MQTVSHHETYEELILLDPVNQVVLTALHLHCMNSLERENTNSFVCLLTRNSLMDKLHDNVFRSHERELLLYLRSNHGRKDNEAVSNVVEKDEKGVSQEEHLWDIDSADGTIVKSPLKPLARECI